MSVSNIGAQRLLDEGKYAHETWRTRRKFGSAGSSSKCRRVTKWHYDRWGNIVIDKYYVNPRERGHGIANSHNQ